jgi:hypothetical protein
MTNTSADAYVAKNTVTDAGTDGSQNVIEDAQLLKQRTKPGIDPTRMHIKLLVAKTLSAYSMTMELGRRNVTTLTGGRLPKDNPAVMARARHTCVMGVV